VRRGFVAQKYADIIEALYADAASVAVTTVIRYQDGRQATLQTELSIRTVGEVLAPAAVGS
jgi:long-chain acyl-CoA synthetase